MGSIPVTPAIFLINQIFYFAVLESPIILLFLFILCSVGVVGTSFGFAEIIKNFSNRFLVSSTFVGTTILAIGTSFSEMVNAVIAGVYDLKSGGIEYSLNSFYNITGANLLQIIFLAGVTIVFGIYLLRKQKFKEYESFTSALLSKKILLWTLIFIEGIVLIFLLIFSEWFKKLEVWNINLIIGCFVIVWFIYFFITFSEKVDKNHDSELNGQKDIFAKFSNTQFLLAGFGIWVLFAVFSYGNFLVVSQFDKVLKIPKNIGLGFLLSIITSIPEFSAFFFLFKKQAYKLAVSGFLGSSLFNLTLLFVTQIISQKWLFSHPDFEPEKKKILLWLFTDLTVNLLFFLGAINCKRLSFIKYRAIMFSMMIVALYLNTLILINLI